MRNFKKIENRRSKNIAINILLSFIFRTVSIICNLIIVPVTLKYLDTYKYGVWLILLSIIGWFNVFDLGLGNGLRNKLAETLALKQYEKSKIFVSTTYAYLLIIFAVFFILFLAINFFVNWNNILNSSLIDEKEIDLLVFIVFFTFLIRFVLQIVNIIGMALQKSFIPDLINAIINVLTLLTVIIINFFSYSSLIIYGISISIIPIIVLLFFNLFFFKKYIFLKPSFKSINMKEGKDLMKVGIKFFVIQLSALILFSSQNIVITQYLGPENVTKYNIVYKYFSIIIMLNSIIISPFWSGFTDAFVLRDYDWIKRIMKKVNQYSLLLSFCVLLMIIFSDLIYKIWLNQDLGISFISSLFMGLYTIITIIQTPFVSFINGTGKIKVQLIYGIILAIINIPLLIFFINLDSFNITGAFITLCIVSLPSLIIWPFQFKKIIYETNTKESIWLQ
jgi:O-antigen/teichoic acid export membrane protein